MKTLFWDSSFKRELKRIIKKNPQLQDKISEVLELLASDYLNPLLKSHKLSGQLDGLWSCSVAYDCRIIYTLKQDSDTQEEMIVVVDIGSHDEVY